MTPEQEAAFTEKLTKQFILIPKGRFYYILGGATAALVAIFGISLRSSVTTYADLIKAKDELRAIVDLHGQATVIIRDMEALKSGMAATRTTLDKLERDLTERGPYQLRLASKTAKGAAFWVHVEDGAYRNGQPLNLSNHDPETWVLEPAR